MAHKVRKSSEVIIARNKEIRKKYVSGVPTRDLAEEYMLSTGAISSILRHHNGGDFTPDRELEKAHRINRLKQLQSQVENKLHKDRDEIDVLRELRAEIDGDKVQNATQVNLMINFKDKINEIFEERFGNK